jgi:hypothetical protein
MSSAPDPNKPPLRSKRTSPLTLLLCVVVFAVAGGFAYLYVKLGRTPTLEDFKQSVAEISKKFQGAPIEVMTTTGEKNTMLAVSLKKSAVDEYKTKYEKVRVVIPQLDFDMTAPKNEWPLVGRKPVLEYTTIDLKSVSCTVYGIGADGTEVELYRQDK